MALAEIEIAKRREAAARWDKGEAAVAAQLMIGSHLPSPPELDEETRRNLAGFVQWTTQASVRYCPAKPYVVAAYVLERAATASTDALLRQVDAIARLHDIHNLANPVATHTARAALAAAIPTDPPRSWTKAEKEAFVQLPKSSRPERVSPSGPRKTFPGTRRIGRLVHGNECGLPFCSIPACVEVMPCGSADSMCAME